MKFSILSLFPEFFVPFFEYGVVGQAVKSGLFEVEVKNPRNFTDDRYATVDDRPFGGGDGMVLMAEPFKRALRSQISEAPLHDREKKRVILLSPQGHSLDDKLSREWTVMNHLVLICGRYSGIDQRFVDSYVDDEVSIGDFVLSGGEIPAMALIDSVVRHIPGVLGHVQSSKEDSFAKGRLEHPLFTRPRSFESKEIPEVLLSGDHARIARWKRVMSLVTTYQKRPDLLLSYPVTQEELSDLEGIPEEEIMGLSKQSLLSACQSPASEC